MNAIYVWGLAGAAGGRVVLRIEDHDRVRCRPEFETALREDMEWLGFVEPGAHWTRKRERHATYERALTDLRRTAHVYACDCSRKQIGGERYGGRCRERNLDDDARRGLRVALEPGVETFDDGLLGSQTQEPATQCGDLLLRDRDGQWTYQFAVTVDDLDQQITDVIRGADLLASTGRQLQLGSLLGMADRRRFLHHPLIVKASGEKLSKAAGDSGVRDLRRRGLAPADVIGRAAAAVGLLDEARPVPADAVQRLWTRLCADVLPLTRQRQEPFVSESAENGVRFFLSQSEEHPRLIDGHAQAWHFVELVTNASGDRVDSLVTERQLTPPDERTSNGVPGSTNCSGRCG